LNMTILQKACLLLFLGLQLKASSQTILNGSFESDTSFHCDDSYHFLPSFQSEFYDILDYCDYVYPIMEFPLELWLIIDTCTYNNGQPVLYEESVPDGYFSIAFQSTLFPDDFGYQSGFTMQLSDPIEQGRHCKLSFYKTRQDTVLQVPLIHSYFSPPLIQIGLSNDPHEFGELIHIADSAHTIFWEKDSLEFIAPFDAEYISVKGLASDYNRYAAHLDNFVLESITGIIEFEEQIKKVNLFPNPTIGNVEVLLGYSTQELRVIKVFDQFGKLILEDKMNYTSHKLNLRALPSGVYNILIEGYTPQKLVIVD